MNEILSFLKRDFPIPAELREAYNSRVKLGQKRMSGLNVVICGLARDVEKILPTTIARIERLGKMFGDYRSVIYENDSVDNTKSLLADWANRNSNAIVLQERLGDPINLPARCLKRAARMARYRNVCLETVRQRFSDHTHVIVVDTDLQHGWSLEGVANTFGHDDWDFVGANGMILRRCGFDINRYYQYDAWAFRQDEQFTPLSTAAVNHMSWQRGQSLVPVTSCFGGLGIYRMPAFLAGTYSGEDTEHVTHLRSARLQGFDRVFLNPSQITIYGRHRRRSDLWAIPLITKVNRILDVASRMAGVLSY